MNAPIFLFALCISYGLAGEAHHSHHIPVEGYETKLQFLGQHVEIPETPVKVIKITKTIAVKIPVPYPVKVREKVPYPVHVAKPYPVPVTQIIKVPHIVKVPQKSSHDSGWQKSAEQDSADHGDGGATGVSGPSAPVYSHEGNSGYSGNLGHDFGQAYQVHENSPSSHSHDLSGFKDNDYDSGADSGNGGHGYSNENSYSGGGNFHGFGGNEGHGFDADSKSYDDAIKSYFDKQGSHNPGLDNHRVYNVETANIDHVHYGQ